MLALPPPSRTGPWRSIVDELGEDSVVDGVLEVESSSTDTDSCVSSLPEGWAKRWSERYSWWYYWNETLQESQWDRPFDSFNASAKTLALSPQYRIAPWRSVVAEFVEDSGVDAAVEVEFESLVTDTDSCVSSLPEGSDRTWSQAHSDWSYTNETSQERVWDRAVDSRLPEGWERLWSEADSCWYYWNATSQESQWDRPVDSFSASAETLALSQQNQTDPWCSIVDEFVENSGEDGALEVESILADTNSCISSLPEGWAKFWSEEYSCWYYWNETSQESQWDRPVDSFSASAETLALSPQCQTDPCRSIVDEVVEDSGVDGALEVKSILADTNSCVSSLPEGWEKIWSEAHSDWFYWNETSQESAWDRPVESRLPKGWEKAWSDKYSCWYYWKLM